MSWLTFRFGPVCGRRTNQLTFSVGERLDVRNLCVSTVKPLMCDANDPNLSSYGAAVRTFPSRGCLSTRRRIGKKRCDGCRHAHAGER
jgi:hypothetical protein